MNYYYDTEFLEGTQTRKILGIPLGKTVPTIDLISIGIVSEDDRKYYAISKDFNLKEAWNRFDLVDILFDEGCIYPTGSSFKKVYWIRENVLKPIFNELAFKDFLLSSQNVMDKNSTDINLFLQLCAPHNYDYQFRYDTMKVLIKKHGKSNIQIANEIVEFVYGYDGDNLTGLSPLRLAQKYECNDKSLNPVFYAYYGAYDHVAFCWLFGKMMNLPKGFPMYSRDLKQMLDEVLESKGTNGIEIMVFKDSTLTFKPVESLSDKLKIAKEDPNYPIQDNAHNALDDAKWNKKLHEFIKLIS